MKPKTIYLALYFVGALLPYWLFIPWVMEHGMNLPLFVRELFVNRIGAFWEWMYWFPPWFCSCSCESRAYG